MYRVFTAYRWDDMMVKTYLAKLYTGYICSLISSLYSTAVYTGNSIPVDTAFKFLTCKLRQQSSIFWSKFPIG